ncbi:MFS transporter [Marivita sp.]|uniref:MFS transporter n=1 Tax=Marivita sp. TaxID=2003365 RepID=UPI003A836E66
MSTVDKKRSWFALITGHMAGMIDLAALPVWVGTLIAGYSFLPAQAGGLATLFLIGVVLCNLVVSARFHTMNGRWLAPLGFWVAAFAFVAMTRITDFVPLAVLHFVAGVGTGIGISLTHGSMGLSRNPHRVFAMASFGLGVLAVVYLGVTPQVIAASGPSMLFWVFAAVMGVAALVHTLFFPRVEPPAVTHTQGGKMSPKVWFLILGIVCMALNNAMALSFAERAGIDGGFGAEQVQLALITMGIVAILPAIIAAVLEKKLSVMWVAPIGALLHGGCALVMLSADEFTFFMAPLIFMPFLMIFTHTFLFGYLAKLDPTGRAVAATPAMVMTGSAIGPFLGGTIVQNFGYPTLGIATFVIALIAVGAYLKSKSISEGSAAYETA